METIKFFVSYSHKDCRWLKVYQITRDGEDKDTDLIPSLEQSIRQSVKSQGYEVQFWKDSALNEEPGVEFAPRIKSEIDQADFAILLISLNFLNSDFIRDYEMPWIKERLDQGKLQIIPIMVGKADWEEAPDLRWIKDRHIIAENDPLSNSIEKLSAWENARIIVHRAVRSRVQEHIKKKLPPVANVQPDADTKPLPVPAIPKTRRRRTPWLIIPLAIIAMAAFLYWGRSGEKGKEENVISPSHQGAAVSQADSGQKKIPETDKVPIKVLTTPAVPPQRWSNTIDMAFVKIPAGTFTMGSTSSQADDLAKPAHPVQFTRPFYIGKYEVTQKEWTAVLGTTIRDQNYRGQKPRQFRGIGDRYPMYYVSYQDILAFIQRLNEREKTNTYRLPTETEWEYAARAGSSQDGPANLQLYSWFGEEIGEGALHMVGLKRANPWGAHDMLGNAAELIYNFTPQYSAARQIDPRPGTEDGQNYCLRGGSIVDDEHLCQFSTRVVMAGNSSSSYAGFRLLKEIR